MGSNDGREAEVKIRKTVYEDAKRIRRAKR